MYHVILILYSCTAMYHTFKTSFIHSLAFADRSSTDLMVNSCAENTISRICTHLPLQCSKDRQSISFLFLSNNSVNIFFFPRFIQCFHLFSCNNKKKKKKLVLQTTRAEEMKAILSANIKKKRKKNSSMYFVESGFCVCLSGSSLKLVH